MRNLILFIVGLSTITTTFLSIMFFFIWIFNGDVTRVGFALITSISIFLVGVIVGIIHNKIVKRKWKL